MRDRFMNEMKDAMKSGDKARLSTIRLINSSLKDKDIEARGLGKEKATPEEILALLQKMIKQRQDSVAMFQQGGRQELADQELAEIAVIQSFLPKQMSEEEVKATISALISEVGATSTKDMGKVIALIKERFSGQMDFGKASGLIKGALSS
jgi:uncharacterized protein YqeY